MEKTNLSKCSISELAVFSNKLAAYIRDIDRTAIQLDALDAVKESQSLLFDTATRRKNIEDKRQIAAAKYDEIQIELESRCKEKIGFDFNYAKLTKIHVDVDKMYHKFYQTKN